MPIVVNCSHCGAPLSAPDEAAGRTLRCSACQGTTVAPGERVRPTRPAPPTSGGGIGLILVVVAAAGVLGLAAAGAGVWWVAFRAPPEVAAPNAAAPVPPTPPRPDPAPRPPTPTPPRPVTTPTRPSSTPPTISLTPLPVPKAGATVTIEPRARFSVGPGDVYTPRLSADGARAALTVSRGAEDQSVEVWDLAPAPKRVATWKGFAQDLSPDGRRVIHSAPPEYQYQVADAATGKVGATLAGRGFVVWFAGPDQAVTVRPAAKIGAEAAPNPLRVDRYDVATGAAAGGFDVPGHLARNPGVKLVDRGRALAVGWGPAHRVEVWDVGTGERLRGATLANPRKATDWSSFEVSPDGTRATAQRFLNEPLVVFDAGTGAVVGEVKDLDGPVLFVPGRPDLMLAGRSWYRNGEWVSGFRVQKLTTGAEVARLVGGRWSPVVSADGRVLVSRVTYDSPELVVFDLTRLP